MPGDRPRNSFIFLLTLVCASPVTLTAQEPAPANARPAPATPSTAPTIGIGAVIRPVPTDGLNLQDQARALPQEKKDRIHFFLVNGLDPLYAGNLNGVAAYFRSLGFTNTNCYQFPSTPTVRRQIEHLRRTDPDARIVLLGYSVGANCVRSLANNLQRDGVYIDCLIYLGGDTVFNTASSKPGNVGQIVNVTGHGMIFLGRDIYFRGENIDGAVNRRVAVRHITLPVQRETIDIVGHAVLGVATAPTRQLGTSVQPASATPPAP